MDHLITNDICLKILKQCEPDKNHTITDIKIRKFSEETKGFMGEHFNLEIIANRKAYTFFIKSRPILLPSFDAYVNELGIFQKETKLYGSLLEILRKFGITTWGPKCYHVFDTDAIIMENLVRKGYKIYDNREYFNYNQVKALVKALAAFHSTSIIYEELTRKNTKIPDFKITDKYAHLLEESAYHNNKAHVRSKWLVSNTEAFLTVAKCLDNFKPEYEQVIRDKFMYLPDLMKSRSTRNYRKVVNHGDLWCNNTMFRDVDNGLECVLVDFQFCRYASPAQDLMLAFWNTTNAEFRDKYYDHFMNIYYDSLTVELKMYSLDINEQYPKSDYLQSCEEYRVIGILEAALFSMLVFYASEDVDHMYLCAETFFKFNLGDKNDFVLNIFKKDVALRERVNDVFNDIVKYVL